MQSLDKPDPEIDCLWGEETLRKLASLDAGHSKTYLMDEVFSKKRMRVQFEELAKLEFDAARAWYATIGN